MAVAFRGSMGPAEWIACGLLFFYGIRLAGFLLHREIKNAAYRRTVSMEMERSKKMPLVAKLSLWVSCGFLYTLMTIPLYYRMLNQAAPDAAVLFFLLFHETPSFLDRFGFSVDYPDPGRDSVA